MQKQQAIDIRWYEDEVALFRKAIADVEADEPFGPHRNSMLLRLHMSLAIHLDALSDLRREHDQTAR